MLRLLVCLPLVLPALACFGTKLGPDDAGVADAGPQVIACGGDADPACPTDVPVCSFGVCKRPCAANDGCVDPNTFCNAGTGFCEPGCRDSSTCADGKVCSAGTCITSQGCATKCDCAIGQVCVGAACQDPPASCNSPDDCAKASDAQCDKFQCNGFTHQCFDPDPSPCSNDTDCIGRPGCGDGCTCIVDTGTCSTNVQCSVDNEATTCGSGFYCGGGVCQAAPACTQESDCTAAGLTCNAALSQCERSHACTGAGDCTQAPNTFCDTAAGRCAPPLCTNGGTTCTTGQTCAADGRCVTQGNGAACTTNGECQISEYCAVVNGNGQCAVGCRDNGSCTNGQQCDGSHTCVGGGGLGGFQATCGSDADCQSGLVCGLFTNTCGETCPTSGSSCNGSDCCVLSGACRCNSFGFCSNTGC